MTAGQTILVVEDSPTDVLLIKRAFARVGIPNPIVTVPDGQQAIEYFSAAARSDGDRSAIPALLLLDLKLPRQSGLDVLAWIKRQPMLKRLPVVILTSSAESVDVERAYDLGANSYLVKPVAFDDLERMLTAVDLYWLRTNHPPQAAAEA
jgi:CheY-like chemotaxis protein